MSRTVSVEESEARYPELVRRAEVNRESIVITRQGKPVVTIQPATPNEAARRAEEDWVERITGLFADHPEGCDEIDKVYAERKLHMPRQIEL